MKKILTILMMSLLMISFAFAASENIADNQPEMGVMDSGNQPPIVPNQTQTRLRDGTHLIEGGQQLQIREHVGEMMQLQSGTANAQTRLEMMQQTIGNQTKLQTKLSNGRNAEIRIMPNVASERAMQALRLHNCVEAEGCSIELKEVGQGEQVRAAYEVKTQKDARMLGLFKTRMQVQAQIDAENGEVLQTNKPWWAFLAAEQNAEDSEQEADSVESE
jgi:hypothetical protein